MQATAYLPEASPENLPRAEGPSFRVDDLDIGTLKAIGKLSINWTMHWDEHLLLDIEGQRLNVAWFLPSGLSVSLASLYFSK